MAELDKETLRQVAETLYKKSVEFEEGQDVMTVLTELQQQHSDVLKKAAEEKYNYGFKNGAVEVEKKLLNSFGIEEKLHGEDLVNYLKESFESKASSSEEVEKIKNDYKQKLENLQKQNAEATNEYKAKYESLVGELAKKEQAVKFNSAIAPFLADPNLNLSEDANMNAIKIDAYKTALSKYNLSFNDAGVQVLGEDGTPLLDNLGRIVTFEEVNKNLLSALIGYKNAKAPSFKSSETVTKEGLKKWLDENDSLSNTEEYQKKRSQYFELMKNT